MASVDISNTINSYIEIQSSVQISSSGSGIEEGPIIDSLGFESVTCIYLLTFILNDENLSAKLTIIFSESDDGVIFTDVNDSSYTNQDDEATIFGKDIVDSVPKNNSFAKRGYVGDKRYVKASIKYSDLSPGNMIIGLCAFINGSAINSHPPQPAKGFFI